MFKCRRCCLPVALGGTHTKSYNNQWRPACRNAREMEREGENHWVFTAHETIQKGKKKEDPEVGWFTIEDKGEGLAIHMLGSWESKMSEA